METECGGWIMDFVYRPSVMIFDIGLFLTLKCLSLLVIIFFKKQKKYFNIMVAIFVELLGVNLCEILKYEEFESAQMIIYVYII